MNLTWHIIKKDLRQFRWALAIWLLCLGYLLVFQEKVGAGAGANLRDYFRIISLLTVIVVSFAVLISIVQQDNPTDSDSAWRVRPIAPLRLLAAKLGLLLAVFVGVPLVLVLLGGWVQNLVRMNTVREYAMTILVLASVVLSVAAAASCTRHIAYAMLLWFGVIFASGTLADFLSRFLPKLSLRLSMQMNMNRIITMLAFSALISLAVLLNQYRWRRLGATIGLLIFGAIGSSLVGVLWSYYYFYQG